VGESNLGLEIPLPLSFFYLFDEKGLQAIAYSSIKQALLSL
jgi:hypothetical protein